MKLLELFKSAPYEYHRSYRGDITTYTFTTEDKHRVTVYFRLNRQVEQEHVYCLEFERNGTYQITDEGDAVKIMSTVIAITKEFVEKTHPLMFYFTAHEPSRVKLYAALAKRFTSLAATMGYKITDTLPDNAASMLPPFIISSSYQATHKCHFFIRTTARPKLEI